MSDDYTKGYAKGHQEGYERGLAAAMPLPTDFITVRLPCPLPFMLLIIRAVSRKYPHAKMRQVGQWAHFNNETTP